MIESNNSALSIRKQCQMLSINRSVVYYKPNLAMPSVITAEATTFGSDPIATTSLASDTELANQIHDLWMQMPFYGYRKITAELNRRGYAVNHKRVARIMRQMNISAIYPKPRTSIKDQSHKVYPYLLRGLIINHPNQVWMVDITYLKMPIGFAYLVAIIDVYSRYVLAWSIANTMDTTFCIEVLTKSLTISCPEIINSDQGSQFTSLEWTSSLTEAKIRISMDGKGRWIDNVFIERFWRTVKYEHFFLYGFNDLKEVRNSVGEFIELYNHKRLHQRLNYNTPAEVFYASGKEINLKSCNEARAARI